MDKERISLTIAPGGENHRDNQFIGEKPVDGTGFTAKDLEGAYEILKREEFYGDNVELLNLNELSGNDQLKTANDNMQARVLIIRNFVNRNVNRNAPDNTQKIYKECIKHEWDAKYLDPNKYREEVVDGKTVKLRGKVMNKRARTNICFACDIEQEPDYINGKGRIADFNKTKYIKKYSEKIVKCLNLCMKEIKSKTEIKMEVVEGNRYYDLKKTGIGFHGDTERVVVICITIGGGGNFPMCFQWFHKKRPIGEMIEFGLNDGDVYVMSEKAVGRDWKKSTFPTLRHAAGAKKYTTLKKYDK